MDKTTCLVVGDPHIRVKEFQFNQLMLDEIVEIARSRKPDFIVVLGDTLDTHNKVDIGPLSRAIDWLAKLKEISKLYLLIGNHDIRNNQVNLCKEEFKEHPFTSLKYWSDTVVIDDVTTFKVGNHNFLATPFVPVGEYHDTIKEQDLSLFTACFSHTSFRGVKYRLEDAPINCPDVWPDDAPPMFAGHDHEYQVVKHNLIYIGTPGQQDFGASPDKAVALITFDEGKNYEMERIKLVKIPLRIIRSEKVIRYKELEEFYNYLVELKKQRDIVLAKLKLVGTRAELATFSKSIIYQALSRLVFLKIEHIPEDEHVEKPIYEVISNPDISFEQHMMKLLEKEPFLLQILHEIITHT